MGEATFGPKFWCEIVVNPAQEEEIKLPEIVQKVDEPKQEELQPEPPKSEDQLSASIIAKNDYEKQASISEHKDDLLRLYEFGFTDFFVNEYLLLKHRDAD